jgi:hypothetical protein
MLHRHVTQVYSSSDRRSVSCVRIAFMMYSMWCLYSLANMNVSVCYVSQSHSSPDIQQCKSQKENCFTFCDFFHLLLCISSNISLSILPVLNASLLDSFNFFWSIILCYQLPVIRAVVIFSLGSTFSETSRNWTTIVTVWTTL